MFSPALEDAGALVVAHRPQPARLIAGYREALDEAGRHAPIVIAGVSLGAAVAASWAIAHPGRVAAVLAALPAWTGAPQRAPAALAAVHTAAELRRDGLEATTARMRASSPPWLATELTRSWARQWPDLPDAMLEAARYLAPTAEELATLAVPMGVASASDDPVHPLAVGAQWAATAPHACLRIVTLDQIGAEPASLGAACLAALNEI